ncbi:MAG: hypothetical protein LWW94_08500 [Candidatus Desulfofervidaceae bacterium]|nr:hypothetical protein [Candidatus Desulfofervidaceae bacterium]
MFEEIIPFDANEIKAFKDQNGELYLAFGKNIMRITKEIMRELKRHKTLFLYKLSPDEYAPDSVPVGFEIEEDALGKLEKLTEN